jgi:aryl-alcohol dehydrogenase-like predicted oxidoreductase
VVKISNIVLGSANFGHEKYGIKNYKKNSFKKITSLINFAKKNGIKKLDTSLEYKGVYDNLSKVNLTGIKVSSKFILRKYKDDCIESFKNDFLISLKKLRIKKYDNFFFHNANDLNKKKTVNKIIKILKNFKRKKLINKIGISLNSPEEFKKIKKKFKPDIVQIPFNLFDRRILNKKLFSQFKGIEIQVRSIFLQGLLLMKPQERGNKDHKILQSFDNWIISNKIERYKVCINFINSYNFYKTCVIGVNSKQEITKFINNNTRLKIFPNKLLSKNLNLIEPRKWKK